MKAYKSSITRGLQHGSRIVACDNSGARILKVISVRTQKGMNGRKVGASIGDYIMASVVEGKPEVRKTVVAAVIVRQRMSYMRQDGMRIKFEDNAAAIVKDDLGNPKGTLIKGPIAKEAAERWPLVAKIASLIV